MSNILKLFFCIFIVYWSAASHADEQRCAELGANCVCSATLSK